MKKKDAAAFIGVSTRSLENHAAQGDLSVRYVRGKTGDVADYDEGELRKLRAKLESRRAPRPAVMPDTPEGSEAEPRSLARLSDVMPLQFLQSLSNLAAGVKPKPRVNVGEKLMLTLDDAAVLSSLSSDHLRKAIHAGVLRGKIIGRGFRIKRVDLDAYIKKL
jgi:excisionase family DNA binding protein